MTIVVVGKSSFLAQSVKAHPLCTDWVFLSHKEALSDPQWLDEAECVINFSFPSAFKTQGYDAENDIDTLLAGMIRKHPLIHYIMLSSRMVYSESEDNAGFKEGQPERPVSLYGQAKLSIEKSLLSILGEKCLTILRLSNIFGHESGRHTFFGTALTTLLNEKKIFLDIAPDNERDFLAVWRFAEALIKIAGNPVPGLYNLGTGFGTGCGLIAQWLIEGYGEGELIITNTSKKGHFWLDMTKTRAAFGLEEITADLLQKDCIECAQNLRIC